MMVVGLISKITSEENSASLLMRFKASLVDDIAVIW